MSALRLNKAKRIEDESATAIQPYQLANELETRSDRDAEEDVYADIETRSESDFDDDGDLHDDSSDSDFDEDDLYTDLEAGSDSGLRIDNV